MSGLVNVLVVLAVIALVVTRQLRARKVDTDRRLWVLPVVLAVLAVRDPQLVDPAHRAAAAGLLAASVATVLAMGCVWGWTVRLWREADGSVWAKGTKATVAAWVGMIVLRLGWYGLGVALHVHQSSSALLLSLAGLLLVRGLVVNRRVQRLEHRYDVAA
ncbi:CcdC protein domain-containing protein [Kitasatospora sp. NPDC048540]|uniref:CcdC protein domain-containing protein n=1 Tax=unclassified Kitasatospora TaxID=2633591 RepID=UPI00068F549D|nr:CcdC protein domain-containing protein [Kitasatospora sp. MBT63]